MTIAKSVDWVAKLASKLRSVACADTYIGQMRSGFLCPVRISDGSHLDIAMTLTLPNIG